LHKKDLEGLEIRQRVNQLVMEEDNLVLKKTALALEHKAQVERLRSCNESYLEAEIRLAEARSDVASLTERNKGIAQ
jgi:structural maintenance of chromosomes protein 5